MIFLKKKITLHSLYNKQIQFYFQTKNYKYFTNPSFFFQKWKQPTIIQEPIFFFSTKRFFSILNTFHTIIYTKTHKILLQMTRSLNSFLKIFFISYKKF